MIVDHRVVIIVEIGISIVSQAGKVAQADVVIVKVWRLVRVVDQLPSVGVVVVGQLDGCGA